MACSICTHQNRSEIENAVLAITTSGTSGYSSIEKIAEQFDVSLTDLKMHALFHVPLVSDADIKAIEQSNQNNQSNSSGVTEKAQGDSLVRQLKLREADILANVANEYLVTLKGMGRRINKLTNISTIDEEDRDKQLQLAKLLTKPMVDLYVGIGNEIRQTVKTMTEMQTMLHGPEDTSGAGLAALAAAIRRSDSG